MVLVAVVATAALLAIVLSINWFPTHASAQIGRTSTLYDVLLIASVPIFVIVETVVVFCVWRFRMRPGEELKDGPPIHGNTRLEVVWTVIPALLMFGLAGYAYTVLRANEANKRDAMTVQVTARQFAFEFTYPRQNGKTVVSPILFLPKGRPVVFKLHSLDVVHSFFVPNFAEKLDAVPGITTTLRVTPNRIGTYPAECTELCGPGHSFMRAQVQVVTPSAFQTWFSKQPNNGPPPVGVPPPSATATTATASTSFQLEFELELGQFGRRGQGGLHGLRRLQHLPHARRGRSDGHDRAEPRSAAAKRLLQAGVQADSGPDAKAVHPHRDHQSLRLHPHRLPLRNHAFDFRKDSDFHSGLSTRKLPVQRDSKMTGGFASAADDQQDGGIEERWR